jgi:hypothetical protein
MLITGPKISSFATCISVLQNQSPLDQRRCDFLPATFFVLRPSTNIFCALLFCFSNITFNTFLRLFVNGYAGFPATIFPGLITAYLAMIPSSITRQSSHFRAAIQRWLHNHSWMRQPRLPHLEAWHPAIPSGDFFCAATQCKASL